MCYDPPVPIFWSITEEARHHLGFHLFYSSTIIIVKIVLG